MFTCKLFSLMELFKNTKRFYNLQVMANLMYVAICVFIWRCCFSCKRKNFWFSAVPSHNNFFFLVQARNFSLSDKLIKFSFINDLWNLKKGNALILMEDKTATPTVSRMMTTLIFFLAKSKAEKATEKKIIISLRKNVNDGLMYTKRTY